MKLGKATGSGAGKPSLSRTLWRSVASLPTAAQVERLLAREVARAERNGLHFSLVLFRVRRGGRLGLNEKRLALTLLRRIRLTDEVGWFDEQHLCALLPDTAAPGAKIFADAVCDLVARKGPRPISVIYSFPADWDDEYDGGKDNREEPPSGDGRRERRGGERRGTTTRSNLFAERMGLGAHAETDSPISHNGNGKNGHSHNGNGHGSNGHGPNGHGTNGHGSNGHGTNGHHRASDNGGSGGVAVLEAPAATAVAAAIAKLELVPAPVAEAPPQVKSIQELLVRPMPWWKRSIDVLGAATALTLLSPILLASAAAIKLSSKGPVVFKQRRAGLGGRPFTIYKFRTMCNDAEAQKKALRAMSEQDGPAFKMERDPRITRVGNFLRKTSIDELPQLLNVLKGDMSLVGPRPLPLDEQGAAETWQQRRLDVTPGLTCIWQIEGRSRVTFAEWVRMDVSYMRRRTIFHDMAILLKTIPAVLLRRGAR